jgi:outer membrane protein assembly factor BamB
MVADGKVYIGNEDGDIVILQHGKEKKIINTINMGSAVYGSVVPANGKLFVMNRNQLFAIAAK